MNLKKIKKTFIIAEIGNNHEGSFHIACKLIMEAKKAGVDAVKFQTFKTKNFINSSEKERFDKLKRFELSYKDFEKLSILAKKNGLKFISTPLDIESAIFLNKIVNYFKIASGDNNYFELIKKVLSFNKPTFISTGLLDFKEIKILLKYIKSLRFNLSKLSFLHCVSDYPVTHNCANLLSIKYLKDKLPLTIGYSDHTIGQEAAIASVILGAKIIEKHFTLSNNFSDFRDHQISLNPQNMKKLVDSIRFNELMLGHYEKKTQKCEKKNIKLMRRSIYASKNIKAQQLIKNTCIQVLRPFEVFEPNFVNKIIGTRLKKNIFTNKPFQKKHFFK
jgi:sialic acid synthase SpsE